MVQLAEENATFQLWMMRMRRRRMWRNDLVSIPDSDRISYELDEPMEEQPFPLNVDSASSDYSIFGT
jgi:hypothetical protein